MANNPKYQPEDLVLVVWPRQSEPAVTAGHITWEEAAREAWAMDQDKADRVRILVAVHDDVVVGAWAVVGVTHEASVPEGKTRMVSRSAFTTEADERLDYLVGTPSPKARQRNPQSTLELRDLPGAQELLSETEPSEDGLVRLGAYTLIVRADGRAEVHMPAGGALTIRTAA
ncbi:hypothetical protein [Geodermatophilus sp. CPCC 206100]|uniref:hypothetical protein n=1 Tax=Geodermatophilus sp. CPCC 206100 TaxID=3020054 RepID=UPI003B004088